MMTIILCANAIAAWRSGQVPMTMMDIDYPDSPHYMRGVWIESPDPETHRVSEHTRKQARLHPAALALLDRLDADLATGLIRVQTAGKIQ